MPVFYVTPLHFFFIGASALICARIAAFVIRATSGLAIIPRREIVKWIFSFYLLTTICWTFFPVRYTVTGVPPTFFPADINLIPFKTIVETFGVLFSQFDIGFKLCAIFGYIGGSFLLLFPFGFFLPQLSVHLRSYPRCFLLSLLLSLCILIIQFAEVSYGISDGHTVSIDTLALNVVGALFGFFCWGTLRRKYC